MAGLHIPRVDVPDSPPLTGDACYCYVCGQRFRNMVAYITHRFVDGGVYVRKDGCQRLINPKFSNTSSKLEG